MASRGGGRNRIKDAQVPDGRQTLPYKIREELPVIRVHPEVNAGTVASLADRGFQRSASFCLPLGAFRRSHSLGNR